MTCAFCPPVSSVLFENGFAYVKEDAYPVSRGHLLVISKRHAETWFDLTRDEQNAMLDMLDVARRYLDGKYSPQGYNIGLNCGAAAGQTVYHVHMHIIPRYEGDCPEPRGGVRGVIPERRSYPLF